MALAFELNAVFADLRHGLHHGRLVRAAQRSAGRGRHPLFVGQAFDWSADQRRHARVGVHVAPGGSFLDGQHGVHPVEHRQRHRAPHLWGQTQRTHQSVRLVGACSQSLLVGFRHSLSRLCPQADVDGGSPTPMPLMHRRHRLKTPMLIIAAGFRLADRTPDVRGVQISHKTCAPGRRMP